MACPSPPTPLRVLNLPPFCHPFRGSLIGQGLLADTKFLDTLRAYDKDNIPQPIIVAVRPYMEMEDFDPVVVKKASAAAYGLCCWVRAMEAYDRVAKVRHPYNPPRGPTAPAHPYLQPSCIFHSILSPSFVLSPPSS